jgi:chlorobactene glucosyltransferase
LILSLVLTLPWLITVFAWRYAVLGRKPVALPNARVAATRLPSPAPLVSVIVPARNEAQNIGNLLASLTASTYPRFEVIVIDDRSEDGTGDIARSFPLGTAERIAVVTGAPLPDGWLGKPWACAQGAREAKGEILLFTDADTTHDPTLLTRSVVALGLMRIDLVTVFGRQLMGSFWERVVQPQVFAMILSRFAHVKQPIPQDRWRDAIANGQFLLFRRDSYDALGGHEAVKHEVVEDLRLSQIVIAGGWKMAMLQGEDALATRMYRGFQDLLRGWTKNMAIGAKQSVPRSLQPVILPAAVLGLTGLWVIPPLLLIAAAVGLGGAGMLAWSAITVAASALYWGAVTRSMGESFWYGLVYPVGSVIVVTIVFRSWVRGRRVEWKGREYRVEESAV